MTTSLRFVASVGITFLLFGSAFGIAEKEQLPAHSDQASKPLPTANGKSKDAAPATIHLNETASRIGLTAFEYARFGTEEDDRLASSIRNAQSIRVLVPNGANLFGDKFKPDFTAFLAKPGVSMLVLFATADSEWYREETEITLDSKPGEKRFEGNLGLVAADRGRLEFYAATRENMGHLHFKYFNTQFRLPIIIIDDKCYMTIRLSPNEGSQSIRMEFTQGYETTCSNHFDKMWSLSSDSPESNRLLAFLGLSSWSRTDILGLSAVFVALFAGIGTYLAIPAFQRLLRFERRQEKIEAERIESDPGHASSQQHEPPVEPTTTTRKGKRDSRR